nr:MAG TPA: hypothetical protein [Caudoviricetes sp.]
MYNTCVRTYINMLKRKKSRGKNCRAFQLSMCYGACLAPRLPIRTNGLLA